MTVGRYLKYAVKIKLEPGDILKDSILDNSIAPNLNVSGALNKICCIGVQNLLTNNIKVFDYPDEKELLKDFWNFVNKDVDGIDGVQLISWNGKAFDFPIIYQRTVANNICMTTKFPMMEDINTFNEKNCLNKLVDLSKIWSCNVFNRNDKLLHVAYACGFVEDKEFFKIHLNYDQLNWYKDYRDNKAIATTILSWELRYIANLAKILI